MSININWTPQNYLGAKSGPIEVNGSLSINSWLTWWMADRKVMGFFSSHRSMNGNICCRDIVSGSLGTEGGFETTHPLWVTRWNPIHPWKSTHLTYFFSVWTGNAHWGMEVLISKSAYTTPIFISAQVLKIYFLNPPTWIQSAPWGIGIRAFGGWFKV